jgi:hypothetical protein
MEPIPNVTSWPLRATGASTSTPLMDIQVYRPGPYLALAILAVPVMVALGGAAISLNATGTIPVWLPFVLLIWLPGLPVLWMTMQSVRTSSSGIAAGRPWRTWDDIPWSLIERVEQRGALLRITGSNGRRLRVAPVLLRDGGRLKRQILLRLPAHVLAGALAQEAQQILVAGIFAMPEGGLSGTLHARPQRVWRAGLTAGALAALAGGALALIKLPLGLAIPLAAVAVVVGGVALRALSWTTQDVMLNEKGISVIWRLTRRSQEMQWAQVELVEHSPREALLRLRGTQRILCAGPALMPTAQRDLMRAFLHEYCGNRGVPMVRRRWLI